MADQEATEERPTAFARLLLGHRRAAGLSQAQLARASGLSVRALRELEHGRAGAAQQRSSEALADALELSSGARELFLTVAGDGRRRSTRISDESALCSLPPAVPSLLGREPELDRLRGEVEDGGVVVITGHPGVGKTALAVWAAHSLVAEFPDGCLAVDLRAMDERPLPARSALDRLLRALGVPAARIPSSVDEQSTLFRLLLDGRRVLVLLDNAVDEEHVRPLLATGPGCLTIVTSRQSPVGLPGARRVALESLPSGDAVELLADIAGGDRVDSEPEEAGELVSLCGQLPLAVRIVGNRLATRPHWTLAYLVAQLRDERTRLRTLAAGDLQVRAAFDLSYRRLSPAARVAFRRLAAVPGASFAAELAAVATCSPDVRAELDELTDANLLQQDAELGRYQLHDLIRIFARERWNAEEKPADRERLSAAVLDFLLETATAAGGVFFPEVFDTAPFPSRDAAGTWLALEGSNWVVAQREASRLGLHRPVLELAKAMHWYSDFRSQERAWHEIFALGVAAARALGERHDEATLLNFVGWAQFQCVGDEHGALATHEEALRIAVEVADEDEEIWAQVYLAAVQLRLGRPEASLARARCADGLSEGRGFSARWVTIQQLLGKGLLELGRHGEALEVYRTALDRIDAHRDEVNAHAATVLRASILGPMGRVLIGAGEPRRAAAAFQEARARYGEAAPPFHIAEFALSEATAWREAGEQARARESLRAVLSLCTDATTRSLRDKALAELERLAHAAE